MAAIRGIDWSWEGRRSLASPDGALTRQRLALAIAQQQMAALAATPRQEVRPSVRTVTTIPSSLFYDSLQRLATFERDLGNLQKEIKQLNDKIHLSKQKAASSKYTQIQVRFLPFLFFFCPLVLT